MSYTTYTATGPFTDGSSPGLSAAYNNAIENFLALLWSDSLITSDHAGGLTVIKTVFTQGSIRRIAKFTGTSIVGKVTVNHGLSAAPDIVLVNYNVTGTPSAATIAPNMATLTSTQVDIWASLAAPFVGLAIAFT